MKLFLLILVNLIFINNAYSQNTLGKIIIEIEIESDSVFTKADIIGAVPGGDTAWKNSILKKINTSSFVDNGAKKGKYTVMVQYLVDKGGHIGEVKSLSNSGYGMEAEAMRVIRKGSSWTPALQNGREVMPLRTSSSAPRHKIEYRHDSLFVNKFYVDAQTRKSTLDSLLNAKARTKTSKDKDKINPATGKKVVQTTDFYYDLGLYFRRYDYDTTKLSVGIKLYRDTDAKEDKHSELTETFKGDLYIADNYINYERTVEQLQQLKNCSVTISTLSLGSYSSILGGDIVYLQNIIRLSFDSKTSQLKSLFIHHNFKDR